MRLNSSLLLRTVWCLDRPTGCYVERGRGFGAVTGSAEYLGGVGQGLLRFQTIACSAMSHVPQSWQTSEIPGSLHWMLGACPL